MYGRAIGALVLAAVVAGCKEAKNGRVVIERPGEVHVTTKTDTLTLPKIDLPKIHVGQAVDTVNTPTFNIGVGKRTVKHPTVEVTRH